MTSGFENETSIKQQQVVCQRLAVQTKSQHMCHIYSEFVLDALIVSSTVGLHWNQANCHNCHGSIGVGELTQTDTCLSNSSVNKMTV